MDTGGDIFVSSFSRTLENAFPDAFLRFAMVYLKMCHYDLRIIFIIQQKNGVAMAPHRLAQLCGSWVRSFLQP